MHQGNNHQPAGSNMSNGAPPTVATALELLPVWTDLSPGQRRDRELALNHLAPWSGLPADAIPLTAENVRRIAGRSAAALGVAEGTKKNICYRLADVLTRMGILDPELPHPDAVWTALLARFENCRERAGVTRFARFCTREGITPEATNSGAFSRFETYLETRTLSRDPVKLARSARTSWNRAARRREKWPTGIILLPPSPRQYVLSLDAFAESFRQDMDAFANQLRGGLGGDDFDPAALSDPQTRRGRDRFPLRESSIALRLSHGRWAASALVAAGVPADEITSLAVLVERENSRKLLRFLYQRAGKKPSAAGMHAAEALRIIARHHVGLPPAEVAEIIRLGKIVRLTYEGMTTKNERTIREAMSPEREKRLLELAAALATAATKLLAKDPRRAARLMMRAIAIEIFTKIPLRLDNIRTLRLSTHLHRADPGSSPITGILIELPETKNSNPIVAPVSAETGKLFQLWLDQFRSHIAPAGCDFLFPGARGNAAITPQALRDAVKDVTWRYAGVVLTPHQFRHLAARRFLEEFPGHYEEVRQMLGHKDIKTTIRSYSGTEQDRVLRRHDEVINRRRSRLGTGQSSDPAKPSREG